MRVLGVDYGKARIGLAVGDGETGIGFPLRSLAYMSDADAIASIVAAADEESADRIVIGMPYRMTGAGELGETQIAVSRFIELLQEQSGRQVDVEDERMTTAMVERMRKEAGMKLSDFDSDAAAAAAIVESYLERHKR